MLSVLSLVLTLSVLGSADGIDLSLQQGSLQIDPSILASDGYLVVSLDQSVGQTLTVGESGQLAGIEIAPALLDGAPDDQLTLEVYDSLDQLLGTSAISARDMPLGGPGPLLPDATGPGYFDLAGLGISVTVGQTLSFLLVPGFDPGACDLDTYECTAGNVGAECVEDYDCEGAFAAGFSNDSYAGGLVLVNGTSHSSWDLAFKVLVVSEGTEDQVTLQWTGGAPSFEVWRSEDVTTIAEPTSLQVDTESRLWVDAPPAEDLWFYHVTSTCVVDPPERCDGIDNDCDGAIDGPGSEASCELAHATPACTEGSCVIDTCDPGFADCDTNDGTGCEADLDNDVDHCGSCGYGCDLNHATPVCVSGLCDIAACDTGFDDCDVDPTTGCEIDTQNDVDHCGSCGNVCNLANATSACTSGSCTITACDPDFGDCDADDLTGCESDLQNDSSNCGFCGHACSLPNATAGCSLGSCFIVSCDVNYWDANENPVDGCEYSCTFQSSTDVPDDGFVDANCDGVDGNANEAIFVATDGHDSWPGTRDQPKRTVSAAILEAVSGGSDVYISAGTYPEPINLQDGVSLVGGYNRASNWSRSDAHVSIIEGGTVAVYGYFDDNIVLDHLEIRSSDATSAGESSYAVRLDHCTNITVRRSVLSSGRGRFGNAGSTGGLGSPGSSGGNGQAGCEESNIFCSNCEIPIGGYGGPGCRYGGAGGAPGNGPGNGSWGSDGFGPGSGSGGLGGNCDRDTNGSCGVATACYSGRSGSPGGDGGPGTDGTAGSAFNTASTAVYTPSAGAHGGSNGTCGGGGGGGGGGHGGDDDCDSYGSAGGGGGGGGYPGFRGTGGNGGGGSFGVWIYMGTGIVIDDCEIHTDDGGAGGAGGNGGGGGFGGPGGIGWFYGGSGEQDDGGCGGGGGEGGRGGRGGYGGGGGGGPSIGIVLRQCTSCSHTGNDFYMGSGGSGGGSQGHDGANGLSATVHNF